MDIYSTLDFFILLLISYGFIVLGLTYQIQRYLSKQKSFNISFYGVSTIFFLLSILLTTTSEFRYLVLIVSILAIIPLTISNILVWLFNEDKSITSIKFHAFIGWWSCLIFSLVLSEILGWGDYESLITFSIIYIILGILIGLLGGIMGLFLLRREI